MGANTPDFPKKFNILGAKSFPSGNDQVEWLGCCSSKGVLIVNGALNVPAFARQNTGKQFIDFASGRNDQRNLLRSATVTWACHMPRQVSDRNVRAANFRF
jgi:hypothetical protein